MAPICLAGPVRPTWQSVTQLRIIHNPIKASLYTGHTTGPPDTPGQFCWVSILQQQPVAPHELRSTQSLIQQGFGFLRQLHAGKPLLLENRAGVMIRLRSLDKAKATALLSVLAISFWRVDSESWLQRNSDTGWECSFSRIENEERSFISGVEKVGFNQTARKLPLQTAIETPTKTPNEP